MLRVIVVEDDEDLRASLVHCLGRQEMDVVGVGSALELFDSLAASPRDVVVLDVGLPDQDGFEVAARLRRRTDLGIIMLTARGGLHERVAGFESGADQYLIKPVDCRELGAAIASLARRLSPAEAPDPAWVLETASWRLLSPEGEAVELTHNEMRLLERLARTPGQPVSRAELLAALGRPQGLAEDRSLDAAIFRLRGKVRRKSGADLPLRTAHARGYVFSAAIERRRGSAS